MTAINLKIAAARAATGLLLVGTFLLINAGSVLGDDKPAEWKAYTFKDQGFTASFPVEPKKTVAKDKSTTSFDAPIEMGTIQYTVAVSVTPGKDKAKIALDAITEKFGEKVKSKRDIELNGCPGRELVIEMDVMGTALLITNRVYVSDAHLYQSLVTSLKSKAETAQGKKFLDSFKILEAPQALKATLTEGTER